MRVVAGTARGRRLRSPEGSTTRPTADRVRESMFNALQSLGAVHDARVADLFAGSGALGIEALSRGAAHTWFVEAERAAADVVRENLAALGFGDRATVLCRPVVAALDETPSPVGHLLDLVLADPPYHFDAWPDLLTRLGPLVARGGIVVAESASAVELPPRWEKMRERTYGGTVITFAAPPRGADA